MRLSMVLCCSTPDLTLLWSEACLFVFLSFGGMKKDGSVTTSEKRCDLTHGYIEINADYRS